MYPLLLFQKFNMREILAIYEEVRPIPGSRYFIVFDSISYSFSNTDLTV